MSPFKRPSVNGINKVTQHWILTVNNGAIPDLKCLNDAVTLAGAVLVPCWCGGGAVVMMVVVMSLEPLKQGREVTGIHSLFTRGQI